MNADENMSVIRQESPGECHAGAFRAAPPKPARSRKNRGPCWGPGDYRGRPLAVVSMHGKIEQVSLAFASLLAMRPTALSEVDTDQLGTFSGEVERSGSAREVVFKKARLGAPWSSGGCCLASEASFGPHPVVPWLPFHEEWMVLWDPQRDCGWLEVERSSDTVYQSVQPRTWTELEAFLRRVDFPQQALVLKSEAGIAKGMCELEPVRRWVSQHGFGDLTVMTDMRAHHCPSRRRVIRRVALKLARRLRNHCPECRAGGFGVVDQVMGLPCALCGFPVEMVRELIDGCQLCGYQMRRGRPDGRTSADPGQCAVCNP